ncbi:MAG: betaine--homocysteine S-methyltransferase, partial [Vicinamibacterales bacterium]
MTDPLSALLAERPWLLADGATGTNLFQVGLEAGEAPELWNVSQPEKVTALNAGFVAAGSDIVLTNSFGGSRYRLKLHKAEARVAELNAAAARIARQAADAARDRRVLVAGSLGPTGEILAPVGPLSEADATAAFAEQASALAEGGADLLWIETISSFEELRAALAGAGTTGLPIVATLSFDTNGRTMMGVKPDELAAFAAEAAPKPAAYGANCGSGAAELVGAMLHMTAAARPGDVLVAKSNCGIPEFVDGHICYSGTPELMADYACLVRDLGVRIIGGCCGTTAEHVSTMRAALTSRPPGPRPGLEEIANTLGPLSAGARGEAA